MATPFTLTPRDHRSTAFFWLGVGIFPVFWSWITLNRRFAEWQRVLAFAWLAVVALMVLNSWPQVTDNLAWYTTVLPVVGIQLTLALSVWLLVRLSGCRDFFWPLFILLTSNIGEFGLETIDVLSTASIAWIFLLTPLLPAMLHLALPPAPPPKAKQAPSAPPHP